MIFPTAFAVTLLALVAFAAFGRSQARGAADFAVASRQAGSWPVAGAIMGTLVGGASTIGTAQLAFLYGLSAWWFTLGAGLACLLLALLVAGPLRRAEVETIPQFLHRYYGGRAQAVASGFSALGMFIHIVAQLLAAGAILSSLFGCSPLTSAGMAVALVAAVTLGGGMRAAGATGLAKLLLLYLMMAGSGLLAWQLAGGWPGLRTSFADGPWFSLFGYGVREGVSDLVSMLVGVLSTQIYLQAIFSARSVREARRGALLSAVLIPPLGLFGILVGLYMRQAHPGMDSVLALPDFFRHYLPPPLAGVGFATLLFAAIGTAAGLTLGVGTTLQVDLVGRLVRTDNRLRQLRLLSLAVLVAALLLLAANLGSAIMQWSFLSMGLRGATLCFPLLAAVFFGSRVAPRGGALAVLLAPVCVLAAGLAGWDSLPPLYLGLAVSLLALLGGRVIRT
ncbi:sodium:solute symporter family protein [Trichloromonas sp.]|uniref:sodium:solute symporter family protein n=1 Tax=Trichloromonas sp. TaxID=3069249 RepID=UPI003D817507